MSKHGLDQSSQDEVIMTEGATSRRRILRGMGAGILGVTASPLLPAGAAEMAKPSDSKSEPCISVEKDGMFKKYLENFPKYKLGHTPTPLQPLERLSEELGGPTIWVKREDSTGLAFGGNKVRKLEYILGKAIADGNRTLVTVGALQSNHVRQTAAAAAVAGLQCEAVVVESVDHDTWNYNTSGNYMLNQLLGANIHRLSKDTSAEVYIAKLMATLFIKGKKPMFVPVGGSNALGSLGHVDLLGELLEQKQDIDAIYLASSSGGTQAGFLAGLALANRSVPVQGVTVYKPDAEEFGASVEDLANETLDLLGVDARVESSRVLMEGGYLGEGYGITTKSCREAIRMLARLEAIILDPVYTGKAMAALVADIKSGKFAKSENVVFVHTGGTPGLFAYAESFSAVTP